MLDKGMGCLIGLFVTILLYISSIGEVEKSVVLRDLLISEYISGHK
jgi:hypothetical protein